MTVDAHWRESVLHGAIILRGRAASPSTVEVALSKQRPEGVVAESYATRGVPPATRLPLPRGEVWARFRFAALPRRRPLTVTWYAPDRRPVSPPVGKPVAGTVDTFARAEFGDLEAGVWRCVVRAGGIVVSSVDVRVG